jgi:hypothetical protein
VIPDKLRIYTVAELESMAETFLKESIGVVTMPIDVELLIESRDDADLDYFPGLKPNHGVLGAVFFDLDTQRFLVVVDDGLADSDSQRNRYRMTVAEELAHLVLHGDVIRQMSDVDDFRTLQSHPDWKKIEANARRFAAAVLMPGSVLLVEANAVYSKLVKTAGYNDLDAIQKYLKNLLASRFEVSPESMGYRLNEWPMRIMAKVEVSMDARLAYLIDS